MVVLQKSDHTIIAELMDNNDQFSRLDQLQGMLEQLRRIQDFIFALILGEANKKV